MLLVLIVSLVGPSAKKKHFEMMRKMHYNEGLNIKRARQLIANELDEEDDEDEEMKDDTDMEDINVDPPQDGDEFFISIITFIQKITTRTLNPAHTGYWRSQTSKPFVSPQIR